MSGTDIHSRSGSRLRMILQSGNEFWLWWGGELAGLVPDAIRKYLKVQRKSVRIQLIDGSCRLHSQNGSSSGLLTEFLLDQEPNTEEVGQRKMLTGITDQVVLMLPSHYILRKTISLPAATRNKLSDVLNFEMDRNTPFKADEVYFSYQVGSEDQAHQKLQVNLAIVTRAVLDELLERLEKQGVVPTRVVPEDAAPAEIDNPAMNLLPQQGSADHRVSTQRKLQQKFWVLLILIVLIALGGLYQRHQRVESLTQEIEEPRALAMQAKKLRTELEQLQESRQFLYNRKITAPSTLILLNELTGILPDNTWLTRLSVTVDEITFQGTSTNASALIGLVEGSEMFLDVRFSSPVTIDPRSQKERFSITAKLQESSPGGAG